MAAAARAAGQGYGVMMVLLVAVLVMTMMTSSFSVLATDKLIQSNPCSGKSTCSECLQTPSCSWCAVVNFTTPQGKLAQRCHKQQTFDQATLQCPAADLKTFVNAMQVTRNQTLSIRTDAAFSSGGGAGGASAGGVRRKTGKATQITPQRLTMSLRVKQHQDVGVEFAMAPDYPIDLYYLMDLSNSMKDDKETLSTLGQALADEMAKLTSNFRVGFGSFVDKVVMPYVSTVQANLISPCDGCAAPYGFKHGLSLTDNIQAFTDEVASSRISGNLDAPEGGFDALMQAIVCHEQIGWRSNARKLLVYSSDADFHYAGDGKLGGIVKPNDGQCHLDNGGEYTHSVLQDYPSVSHINQKVKENSVNIIFAVSETERRTYEELTKYVEASSSGVLERDSSNVVQLIRKQYEAITSSVKLTDNSTDDVSVRYFSSCLTNGPAKETHVCNNLKIGQLVEFSVRVELVSCPEDSSKWRDTIAIKPVGINESMVIDLTMMCECDCDKQTAPHWNPLSSADHCNNGGVLKCGKCVCDDRHFGAHCECSHDSLNSQTSTTQCRPDNTTDVLCSGRGECICGVCRCEARPNPIQVVSGDYCECDNFSCERRDKLLCSGSSHGTCVCGACSCRPGWTGTACECPATNKQCIASGESIECSGNGECVCGECKCKETKDGRYSGKYCEDCPTCRGKCADYRPCVDCIVFETGELKESCEANCSHLIINTTDVVEVETPDERMCMFSDEQGCRYRFVYGLDEDKNPIIRVQESKKCPPAINILGIVLTLIAAIVVVGLAVLMLWKLLTTIHDRREYAKWDSERKSAKWDTGENPIYKQATSTYKNPAYGK